MIILSIDIRDGRAVQLRRGAELVFTDLRDPVELARQFGRYGPVAVVDLDAALGTGHNNDIVRRCCRVARCRVGGGIRTEPDVRERIRWGAEQVMIGTMATPEFLKKFPRSWIVACLDARGDEVVTEGWTAATGRRVLDLARELEPFAAEFLFTQVELEGMLGGADLTMARALRDVVRVPVTVAGGIHTIEEIRELEDLGCNSQLGRAVYENRINPSEAWAACLSFDDRGLVPTIVQDDRSGEVLMLAWSNAESIGRALESGQAWYWSRSRHELWRKGATSGNEQELLEARYDCDRDAVLFRVRRHGPACHRGTLSCFDARPEPVLSELESLIRNRAERPAAGSYTQRLIRDPDLVAAKLREEAEEVIEASEPDHLAWECADLLYHLLARMRAGGISLDAVERELRSRVRAS